MKGLISLIGGLGYGKIVLLSSSFALQSNWSNYTRIGSHAPNQGLIQLKLMLTKVYNVAVHSSARENYCT